MSDLSNMLLPITTLSTLALCCCLFILSVRIFKIRHEDQISIGSGKNEELAFRIRAHANLIEYAPLGLLLILLAELQSSNITIISLLGLLALAFVIGRLIHGVSFSYKHGDLRTRVLGMQLTIYPMMGLCLLNLVILLINLFS